MNDLTALYKILVQTCNSVEKDTIITQLRFDIKKAQLTVVTIQTTPPKKGSKNPPIAVQKTHVVWS